MLFSLVQIPCYRLVPSLSTSQVNHRHYCLFRVIDSNLPFIYIGETPVGFWGFGVLGFWGRLVYKYNATRTK